MIQKHLLIVISISMLVVFVSTVCGGTTSENPTGEMIPTATATPEPIIDANLRTILDLYESNKVAAESEYKSKLN